MLRIWVDSLGPDLDPIEELIDSLNTIEKKALAGNKLYSLILDKINLSIIFLFYYRTFISNTNIMLRFFFFEKN